MAVWQKVLTSGSRAHVNEITASGTISANSFGKANVEHISASNRVSASNFNAGTPTSNAWQTNLEGSYFNNFNSNTDVSEILRFIAGAMSHSLDVSDASPNTKLLNDWDTSFSLGSTTSTYPLGDGLLSRDWENSPKVNATQLSNLKYSVEKGWTTSGTHKSGSGQKPWGAMIDKSPYYNTTSAGNAQLTITSTETGTTTVSSDGSDNDLFGMGTIAAGKNLSIYIACTQSFSDNMDNATPNQSSNTYTTQSNAVFTLSDFGTSNGLTLSQINTAQPAVIPAAYQDGKIASTVGWEQGAGGGLKYKASSGTTMTSISASGYYRLHDIKVGIKSGSQSEYDFGKSVDAVSTRLFFPKDSLSYSSPQTIAGVTTATAKVTQLTSAPSRSLSGAPYITAGTSTFKYETAITGAFDPAFYPGDILDCTVTENTSVAGTFTITAGDKVQCDANGVVTSTTTTGQELGVLAWDGSAQRADNDIPYQNDIAQTTASISHTISSTDSNITATGIGDTEFIAKTTGRKFDNTTTTGLNSVTTKYHTPGTYDHIVASGSMAIYGRSQGYDSTTVTSTIEAFTGEDNRIQLTDAVRTFGGVAWDAGSFDLFSLGDNDLQVKPGYLVDPGNSTYGYWYPTNYGSAGLGYKYYIRKFQISGTKASLSVDIGKTLVGWTSTTAGVAVAVLFKSSGAGSGGNASLSTCRIFDISDGVNSVIETNSSAGTLKNPFSSVIDIYGCPGGSKSSTNYTVDINNNNGMYLDDTDNQFYVIVRYKVGWASTPYITSITTSTS